MLFHGIILRVYLTINIIPDALSLNSQIIVTTTGILRGRSVDERVRYKAYEGIPYAEPPIGRLRFKAPVPKTPWNGVFDATKFGHICPQTEGSATREQMSEDCLFLNVYVPENKGELLPVLVYVHGGEFKSRSGNPNLYGPELLLQRNIIVVTFNSRLGALGYATLDIDEASGNAGLKDIILALRWINANIERFGGERTKITLGGNSSGGVSVHYILLTTKSTGLFQQAILISGSATGYRFLAHHAKKNTLTLTKQLGIQANSTYELLERLREVDAFDIVQAQEDIGNNDKRKGFRPLAPFVPCAEIENESAVITKTPKEIIERGIPQNVPILAGFNTDEGIKMIPAITKNPALVDYLNNDFELCIPSDIEYPYGSNNSIELAKSIREFYFNGTNISNNTIYDFIKLITDSMFSYSIDSWIKIHNERRDSKKLYYYNFGFDGELNWFKIANNVSLPGTSHGDELGYLFVTDETKARLNNLDDRSQRMVNIMTTVFTNFVKFGNPTPQKDDIGVIWQESGKQRKYLYISDNVDNYSNVATERMRRLQFWYNVYEQYCQYLENGGQLEDKDI